MSNRPHAHSKRKRSAPPRSFSAATGLHGATEAELALRAQITEAALADVEQSTRSAVRPSRFTRPKAARVPATRPPRTFSLPAEPIPGPDRGADAGKESEPLRPIDTAADPGAPVPPDAEPAAKESAHRTGASGEGSARREESPRPRRSLVTKLSAAVAARSGTGDDPVDPPLAGQPSAPSGPALASAVAAEPPTPTATVSPKKTPTVSRGPKGGRRWGRPPADDGDRGRGWSRRPPEPSRPEPSRGPDRKPETKAGTRRSVLALVGRKKSRPETTTAGSSSESRPRTSLSRSPSAPSAPAGKSKPAKQRKPETQRTPATPDQRRRRIPVAIAGAFALAVLATSFPLSSILSQHHQLTATGAQLAQVQKENRELTKQEHALDSSVAVTQLARGELQMVSPGQTLYDVLPPSSRTVGTGKTASSGATGTTAPGSAVNGDPGNQPLVAPANAPDLTAQAALPQPTPVEAAADSNPGASKGAAGASPVAASAVPPAPTTFWGRVSQTLQFWK